MAGPLSSLKVLDLSRFIAGPYCAMMLADMGAEVIKIETSISGDPGRRHPPLIEDESLYHQVFNRNKSGMLLNLREEQGRAILRDLILKADIVVENFRPGTLDKMGFSWEELHRLNPGLILASITGFGQEGPLKDRPCFDVIAQAMSGLMSITGSADGPPMRYGSFVTDYTSGMYSVIGILAALNVRNSSGKGQHVNVSLIDSAMSLLMTAIPEKKLLNRTMGRHGNRDRYGAPSSAYKTARGDWVFIAAGNSLVFPRLAAAMEEPGLLVDPRFDTMDHRLANFDDLEPIVARWFARYDTAEVLDILTRENVPCARVNSIDEMLASEDLELERRLVTVDHPKIGKVPMQGVTVHLSDTPLDVVRPAPGVGEHDSEVLKSWLGWSDEEIASIKGTKGATRHAE